MNSENPNVSAAGRTIWIRRIFKRHDHRRFGLCHHLPGHDLPHQPGGSHCRIRSRCSSYAEASCRPVLRSHWKGSPAARSSGVLRYSGLGASTCRSPAPEIRQTHFPGNLPRQTHHVAAAADRRRARRKPRQIQDHSNSRRADRKRQDHSHQYGYNDPHQKRLLFVPQLISDPSHPINREIGGPTTSPVAVPTPIHTNGVIKISSFVFPEIRIPISIAT